MSVKEVILDMVIVEILSQVETAEKGRRFAVDESKAHKGAMQSRYDTFKEEAQYLAGAQNKQRLELTRTLVDLKALKNDPPKIVKCSSYALIEVESCHDNKKTKYFLLPAGGGNTYEVGGEVITVLTLGSPIARALIGKVEGDIVEIRIQDAVKELLVLSVE
jgi:hypothetical protein